MSVVKLIGLCGAIGAGKDLSAQILSERYGFERRAFADPLKFAVLSAYRKLGMEWRHVFGTQADKNEPIPGIVGPDGLPRTGRECAEILGTEGYRAVCPTTWTQTGLLDAGQLIAAGHRVVFTDARFRTEFDAIRAAGGVVWEVVKVGGDQAPSRSHQSDREWRELPKDAVVVARSGDVDGLARELEAVLFVGGRRHEELLRA